MTLDQVACAEKSNEIIAIPWLLKLLNLKGCTVTIDAMGCQKEIAEQIRTQKGHYVLALKGNQSGLERDMQQLCDDGIDNDFAGLAHETHETAEKGHGRCEQRICRVVEIPANHPRRVAWKDLCTLTAMTCGRQIGESQTWETRFYIRSHAPKAKPLAEAIRKHWNIENTQHWSLDVTSAKTPDANKTVTAPPSDD